MRAGRIVGCKEAAALTISAASAAGRQSLLPGVLALLLLASQSATASSQPSRRVLLLYADEKDLPMNLIIDRQLRSCFRENLGDGVELFSEYLDLSRFPEGRLHRKQLEFLRDRYRARGLDLVVVIDHPALDLIGLHRDWFIPATPVVFCCVTEEEYKARKVGPGVMGVPAKLAYGPTLELALRLHPATRRVVVIAGATKYDAQTMADARRDFRPFEEAVEFRYLAGLPMADLRQEVSQLPRDTIIIYLSIARDGAGTSLFPREALVRISRAAGIPIYGYYDSYLGHGIVGGFMASFEIEAKNAARLGLRILAGEKPEGLSAHEAPSCAYLFDWRQLRRWGIDEADLPPGSVVRFRDPSFWDLYRWHIVGVLSLCAVQAMLIVGLLTQRARSRRAEGETRQAEERFRMVVESGPNAIVVVNAEGTIVLVNARCEQFFGYGREELAGRPVEILVPERFRTERTRYPLSPFASPSAQSLETGHDLLARRKDTSEFPVEVGLAPIRTSTGDLILCVIVDLTARKQAEEVRRELAHASRLALVGVLTASIAHEINQPLGAILSNADAADMLLESAPESLAEVRHILDDIRRDDLRASQVIRRLRALLRKREMERQPVDLEEVISEVIGLIQAESGRRGVAVETKLATDLPLIQGDRIHLQQILLNLLLNGMDAMADGTGARKITVGTALDENGHVALAVSDAGPGIVPDQLRRLFEPFFSTKKEGMGLGLAIARSLVEAHGGRIWAENNPRGGATFRVTLPPGPQQPVKKSSATQRAPVEEVIP